MPHDPPHAALATTTATVAPPGGRVSPAAAKTKPAAAETTAPAAVGATPTKPGGWGLLWFIAVFAIVGLVVWVVVRRRRRE